MILHHVGELPEVFPDRSVIVENVEGSAKYYVLPEGLTRDEEDDYYAWIAAKHIKNIHRRANGAQA